MVLTRREMQGPSQHFTHQLPGSDPDSGASYTKVPDLLKTTVPWPSSKGACEGRTCNLWWSVDTTVPTADSTLHRSMPLFQALTQQPINVLVVAGPTFIILFILAFRVLLSSFVGVLYRPPRPFLNITHNRKEKEVCMLCVNN